MGVMSLVSRLKYGNTNTYFIRGTNGNLLIDTDYAGTLPLFYKELKKYEIRLSNITYVLATHYHPDHMGIIGELMELGVKLLLVDIQLPYVHFSDEIFNRDKRIKYVPVNEKAACVISCEESRAFFHDMGIEGELLCTPSHSKDSISLVLDGGACFVGDLEPMDHLGAYGENRELKRDWELVMGCNPKVVFYGHARERVVDGKY